MSATALISVADEYLHALRFKYIPDEKVRNHLIYSTLNALKGAVTEAKKGDSHGFSPLNEFSLEFEARWRLLTLYLEHLVEFAKENEAVIEENLQRISVLVKRLDPSRQTEAFYRVQDTQSQWSLIYLKDSYVKSAKKLWRQAAVEALEACLFGWYCHFQFQLLGLGFKLKDLPLILGAINDLQAATGDGKDEKTVTFLIYLQMQKMLCYMETRDAANLAALDEASNKLFELVSNLCKEAETNSLLIKEAQILLLIHASQSSNRARCQELAELLLLEDCVQYSKDTAFVKLEMPGSVLDLQLPWTGKQALIAEKLLLATFALQQDPQLCITASQQALAVGEMQSAWELNCQFALHTTLAQVYLLQGKFKLCLEHLSLLDKLANLCASLEQRALLPLLHGMLVLAKAPLDEPGDIENASAKLMETIAAIEGRSNQFALQLSLLVYAQLCVLYLTTENATAYLQSEKLLESTFAKLDSSPWGVGTLEQAIFCLVQSLNALAEKKVKHTKLKALEVIKQGDSCGSLLLKTVALCTVGCLYINVQPKQAEKMFKTAYSSARRLSLESLACRVCQYLVNVYSKLAETEQAQKYEKRYAQHANNLSLSQMELLKT